MLKSIDVHQQQGICLQSYHICRANHLKLSKAVHVRVSVVWDPVGTWRSDEHYAALGTAWLLFRALQQMEKKTISIVSLLFETPWKLKVLYTYTASLTQQCDQRLRCMHQHVLVQKGARTKNQGFYIQCLLQQYRLYLEHVSISNGPRDSTLL